MVIDTVNRVFPQYTKLARLTKRNNSCYFSGANQQKAGTKIYSLTQCSLTVNGCDWHILAGNDERINSHCLIRMFVLPKFKNKIDGEISNFN